MTVMLITALRAAEALAAFHRQRAANAAGAAWVYHMDMARGFPGQFESAGFP
jgi:hypothetical protein